MTSLNNVTIVEGAVSPTNLPALCCDAVLIRDAYHHFTEAFLPKSSSAMSAPC